MNTWWLEKIQTWDIVSFFGNTEAWIKWLSFYEQDFQNTFPYEKIVYSGRIQGCSEGCNWQFSIGPGNDLVTNRPGQLYMASLGHNELTKDDSDHLLVYAKFNVWQMIHWPLFIILPDQLYSGLHQLLTILQI